MTDFDVAGDRPSPVEITEVPNWEAALAVMAGFEDEVMSASEAILELWGLWSGAQSDLGQSKAASLRP